MHQAVLTRQRYQILKDLLKAFRTDALAKMRAVGVIGNLVVQAQPQEPTEGHVRDGAFHDLTVGKAIVKAQKQDLEHADRIDGRPSPEEAVGEVESWPKCLELHSCHDFFGVWGVGGEDLEHTYNI